MYVCVCACVYELCFCLLGLFIPRILNYKVCLLQATQAWLDASVCVLVCKLCFSLLGLFIPRTLNYNISLDRLLQLY